jgi:hypothetical protein
MMMTMCVYVSYEKRDEEEEKERKAMKSNNNNNKRPQYVLTHAFLLSNRKDNCSHNLMTSFNWQKNDIEKGRKREKSRSTKEREKKDKAQM